MSDIQQVAGIDTSHISKWWANPLVLAVTGTWQYLWLHAPELSSWVSYVLYQATKQGGLAQD